MVLIFSVGLDLQDFGIDLLQANVLYGTSIILY